MNTATKQVNSHQAVINRIINEVYTGLSDMGPVTSHIQPGIGTADFEINPDMWLRVKEQGNKVYYNVFRTR